MKIKILLIVLSILFSQIIFAQNKIKLKDDNDKYAELISVEYIKFDTENEYSLFALEVQFTGYTDIIGDAIKNIKLSISQEYQIYYISSIFFESINSPGLIAFKVKGARPQIINYKGEDYNISSFNNSKLDIQQANEFQHLNMRYKYFCKDSSTSSSAGESIKSTDYKKIEHAEFLTKLKLIDELWTYNIGLGGNIEEEFEKLRQLISKNQFIKIITPVYYDDFNSEYKKIHNKLFRKYFNKGMDYFDSKSYDSAFSNFNLITENYLSKEDLLLLPNSTTDSLYYLTAYSFIQINKEDLSDEKFQKVERILSPLINNDKSDFHYKAVLFMGNAHYTKGDLLNAKPYYIRILYELKSSPEKNEYKNADYNLGIIYEKLK